MRTINYLSRLLLLALFAAVLFSYSNSFAGALKASVVRINITPDPKAKLWLAGFPRKDPSDGVHDDIFMKILALDNGSKQVFIVATDLVGAGNDYYEAFVDRMEEETPIKRDQLLWTFTHTHSAPGVGENGKNPEYSRMIKDKLLEGLKEARNTLVPAKIGVGFGRSFMNINRRATYPDGKVYLARDPYGIVDREFSVIRIEKYDGSLMAVAVNYPCHGVALFMNNLKISGDAPGSVTRYLEKKLGNGVTAMYLNGAAGDVEPVYTCMKDFIYTNFNLDILGIILGDDVLDICNDLEVTGQVEIETVQKVINIPRKESEIEKHGPAVPFRVSLLRLNDLVLAGASAEVFTQIGINIKHMSPYPKTLFVGYCNGSSGYLPTKTAFPEGGYEIDVTHATPDGEWLFTQSVVELLRKMKSMNR
ncbi:MAG TPA: neutral/alkaline non-lysosomal ceramidase N-terminal domain-containing protein [archaeon]|nr:neutral/alkaline non-lysosomal ceramidase N-terminal domain-containing protein [archaeon]